MPDSSYASKYAQVNGIRLHYLGWGGSRRSVPWRASAFRHTTTPHLPRASRDHLV